MKHDLQQHSAIKDRLRSNCHQHIYNFYVWCWDACLHKTFQPRYAYMAACTCILKSYMHVHLKEQDAHTIFQGSLTEPSIPGATGRGAASQTTAIITRGFDSMLNAKACCFACREPWARRYYASFRRSRVLIQRR